MSWYTRRLLALSVVLVVGQIGIVSLPKGASAGATCAELQQWAQRYAHASPTLDDLAHLDPARQLAVFNAISPRVRAQVWREQLTRAARLPNLTDQQRAFLRDGASLITPTLYTHDTQAKTAFDTLWQRAAPAFVTPRERRLWFALGAVVPTAGNASATPSSPLDTLTRSFHASAQVRPPCNCLRGAFNHCEFPARCRTAACQPSGWGCGPAALEECDGQCS